jgi:hypothetical protein
LADGYERKHKYHGIRYKVKERKYHEYNQNLTQEIIKYFKPTTQVHNEEEIDRNLSTIVAANENEIERTVDLFTQALQPASGKTFKVINTHGRTHIKSVPWWTDGLTTMWKRTNALRRLYQRTKNIEELRESRKHRYFEEKKKYQSEIRKEKFNSWKEYCNVTASVNPWPQVYKLAAGKARKNTITTTLRKPDGTMTKNIRDTLNTMLDHIIPEDEEEETIHHKSIRKMVEEPINTGNDTEFT